MTWKNSKLNSNPTTKRWSKRERGRSSQSMMIDRNSEFLSAWCQACTRTGAEHPSSYPTPFSSLSPVESHRYGRMNTSGKRGARQVPQRAKFCIDKYNFPKPAKVIGTKREPFGPYQSSRGFPSEEF